MPEKALSSSPVKAASLHHHEVQASVKKISSLSAVYDAMKTSGSKGSETLVAFDFDLTLKVVNQQRSDGENVEVRGGEDTVSLLKKLSEEGVHMVILTATRPSKINFDTIVKQELGINLPTLAPFFPEDCDAAVDELRVDGDIGSRICYGKHVILAGYDKAAGLSFYLKRQALHPQHIIFIDDFVANAVALPQAFVHDFAPLHRGLALIHGMWFDPKPLMESGVIAESSSMENSHHESYAEQVSQVERETQWNKRHDLEASMARTMTHLTKSLKTLFHRITTYEETTQETLQVEADRLTSRQSKCESDLLAVAGLVANQVARHTVVVGGTKFVTTLSTLKAQDTAGTSMLCEIAHSAEADDRDTSVIDRDPTHFPVILNYLRDGVVYLSDPQERNGVKQEALYYRLGGLAQQLSAPVAPPPPPPIALPPVGTEDDGATDDTLMARETMLRAIRGRKEDE